ncbi:hypothetical protein QT970_29810 [Microcoleus sp. herbarium8]
MEEGRRKKEESPSASTQGEKKEEGRRKKEVCRVRNAHRLSGRVRNAHRFTKFQHLDFNPKLAKAIFLCLTVKNHNVK